MLTSWWTGELFTSQKGRCMGLVQPWIKLEHSFMRCVRTVSVRGSGSWRQFPVYFAILRNSFVQVINYAFFLFVSGKLVSFPWNWLFVYIRWQTVVSGCLLLCQLVPSYRGHRTWRVGWFPIDYVVSPGLHIGVSEFVLSRFRSCRLLGE